MSVITSYDCTFIKAVSVRPAHPALPTASRATHPTSSTDQESGKENPGKCAEFSAGLVLVRASNKGWDANAKVIRDRQVG